MKIGGQRVFHLTGRVRRGVVSLCEPEPGRWLWRVLRLAFPDALATCLMPDHPHLLSPVHDPEDAARRMARIFGQFSRRFGHGRNVIVMAEPQPVASRQKLARDTRYIALNPCRRNLSDDPLQWEFSTYRDVLGAIVDPWVSADRLASALGRPRRRFTERFHKYVSSDPHVRVDGTQFPVPAAPTVQPAVPLQRIVDAALTATRSTLDALARRGPARTLFIQLALDQGWTNHSQLAQVCHCTSRTIRNLAATPRPDLLSPGRLCLADARLLPTTPSTPDTTGHPRRGQTSLPRDPPRRETPPRAPTARTALPAPRIHGRRISTTRKSTPPK